MSYEIKYTPYFRRMVSLSKKSGELQKLKREYERLSCNDQRLTQKLREVRLKRLYTETADIRDGRPKAKRTKPNPATPSNLRAITMGEQQYNPQQQARPSHRALGKRPADLRARPRPAANVATPPGFVNVRMRASVDITATPM